MPDSDEDFIRRHYREQADKHGASPLSTMEDEIVREKEVELIDNVLGMIERRYGRDDLRVLDLGCGNGCTLAILSGSHPDTFWGLDISPELLAIACTRDLPRCSFQPGNALSMPFADSFFDMVYTERCLINILTWQEQQRAVREIHRVLRQGGYYLMIECFTDGLDRNNRARLECGLSSLEQTSYNNYLDKGLFFQTIGEIFGNIAPSSLDPEGGQYLFQNNFLSSHYFIARVLHPLVTKGDWVRNTEFVKFFSFLAPVGNYSPIQAYILQKRSLPNLE